MSEVQDALDEIRACIASGDSDAVEVLIFSPLDDLAMMEEPWSDELFDGVVSFLIDPRFLALETSWKL